MGQWEEQRENGNPPSMVSRLTDNSNVNKVIANGSLNDLVYIGVVRESRDY